MVSSRLPDGDGLALLEALREVTVVVIAEDGDEERDMEALRGGAEEFHLRAELTEAVLVRALRYALERRHARQDLLADHRRLTRLAERDSLTGVLNRRGLERLLADGWKTSPSAALFDVDDFRRVNERLGHGGGDRLLREITAILRPLVRPQDRLARVGGDEFVVLFVDSPVDEAIRLADRMRARIERQTAQRIEAGKRMEAVTVSVGVARLDPETRTVSELLVQCTGGLRRSKTAGKNQVACDRPALTPSAATRDLREALAACLHGRMPVVRSPIVSLGHGNVVGWEYRIRPPTDFPGTTQDLFRFCSDQQILDQVDRRALEDRVRVARAVGPPEWVQLPVFPSTLVQHVVPGLATHLGGSLPPDRVCFALSEKQLGSSVAGLGEAVRRLRHAGGRLAVVDVGFGQSWLETLLFLAPDIIRIDHELVDGALNDVEKARALRRMCAVAGSLGALVIAEASHAADHRVVRDCGIDLVQPADRDERAAE